MLHQVVRDIDEVKQMMIRESTARQEMEARIQTNLDLIQESLLTLTQKKRKRVSTAELKKKFKIPIDELEEVQSFDDFLRRDSNYKEDLVSLMSVFPITYNSQLNYVRPTNSLQSAEKTTMRSYDPR